MKQVTIRNIKDPDSAIEVYKMHAKVVKNRGEVPLKKDELLEYGEYFNVRLNADGTWELV